MPFKPNYRMERAERARSKEAKKKEKLEVQAARRQASRDAMDSTAEEHDAAATDLSGDHHGFERPGEEKE